MSSAQRSPYEPLNRAVRESRRRLIGYMTGGEKSIFAKIYVYTDRNSKFSPIPLTKTDIAYLEHAYVFVTIPPPPPRIIDPVEVVRAYTFKIDQMLQPIYDSAGHPITKINKETLADMVDRGLIYSHINQTTGIMEYWYLVQDLDIISRVATQNEDVEQGYIQLVKTGGDSGFNPVSREDMFPSKGGNKCLLKPKSNKRKKKQNKRNSRRRYRSRKH
jgi:hypothetical protein